MWAVPTQESSCSLAVMPIVKSTHTHTQRCIRLQTTHWCHAAGLGVRTTLHAKEAKYQHDVPGLPLPPSNFTAETTPTLVDLGFR
jgi:hypothetical protein